MAQQQQLKASRGTHMYTNCLTPSCQRTDASSAQAGSGANLPPSSARLRLGMEGSTQATHEGENSLSWVDAGLGPLASQMGTQESPSQSSACLLYMLRRWSLSREEQ